MYIYNLILTSDFCKYPRYILDISLSLINFPGRCGRRGRYLEHWIKYIVIITSGIIYTFYLENYFSRWNINSIWEGFVWKNRNKIQDQFSVWCQPSIWVRLAKETMNKRGYHWIWEICCKEKLTYWLFNLMSCNQGASFKISLRQRNALKGGRWEINLR